MTLAINNRIDVSRAVTNADMAAGDVGLQLALLRAQTNDDGFQRRTAMSAGNDGDIPAVGTLPAPSLTANCSTGPGLETNPAGWPAGSVRDAAGWVIVPEGNHNWSIYSPDQKPGDPAPYSRIWGDPHLTEGDGTCTNFSHNTVFKLPSGTNVLCRVSNEGRGATLSESLTIVNDNSSVTIGNLGGAPQTSAVAQTGFQDRANMIAANLDTFVAGGRNDGAADERVMWAREGKDGKIEGVIGHGDAHLANGDYDQIIDGNKTFVVDASLRPDPTKEPEIFAKFLRGTMLDMAVRMEPSFLEGAVAMAVNDSNIKNSTPGYWEQYLASNDGQLAQTLTADDWLSPIDDFDADFGQGTTEMASGFMLWAMDRAAQEGLNEQMRRLQMAGQG